jgi:hypothetical protein
MPLSIEKGPCLGTTAFDTSSALPLPPLFSQEKNLRTCEELWKVRKETLQEWFGQTKGDSLYRACRGDDGDAPLTAMPPRKSIGIEVPN